MSGLSIQVTVSLTRDIWKVRNKQTIDLIFQQKILEEPDVVELTEFFSDVSNGRTYTTNFRVRTTLGSDYK